uniref:Uncharacterized protein n=1 Tax=Setaria digitata TaxID=48799 RepID=A0A915PWK7_9BILA
MTDDDIFYIGNLILNGTGDGQSQQMLSIIPVPRRPIAPSYARMQIGRVEIVRNFVARQIDAAPENTVTRRLMQLDETDNQRDDNLRQLRGTEFSIRRRNNAASSLAAPRIAFRRRSRVRIRVRSASPNSSILQTPPQFVVDENIDDNLRYYFIL